MVKILLFMSDNRLLNNNFNTASYESLVCSINYNYSKLHGYDFIYCRPFLNTRENTSFYNCFDPNSGQVRTAHWSKLLSTTKMLELKYDYICYIDSDCIFKDFNKKIEELISQHPTKNIIFLNDKPWSNILPCSGFYICKVCDETKKIISRWFNVNIPSKNREHSFEQQALYEIINTLDAGIIDSWMFEEKENQFLRHIGSSEDRTFHNRIPYFKNFIINKKLEYNISSVNIFEFNTNQQ